MEFVYFFEVIFQFCNPALSVATGMNTLPVWSAFVIASALFVLVYAFKAVGLYTMAKNRKMNKLLWAAFVPFASTYLIGELAGELRMGKSKIGHLGLYVMLAEILYVATVLLQHIPAAYAFANNLYNITEETVGQTTYVGWEFSAAFPAGWVKAANVAYWLNYVFMLLYTGASVFMYIAFFRLYAPMSYVWMVILGALLPVSTAFLIFAFRNRKAVDFEKLVQARAEQMRRMQQSQYGNPYGANDPYSNNPYRNQPPRSSSDPFEEYSQKDADPFEEFSSSEKKTDGKDDRNDGTPQDFS